MFGFEVTPPTVIAFLTILGYSLYDTIVVFDRVRENERRVAAAGLSAADLVNVSTNQVLLRSLNTSISAVLPVMSLLLIGAGMLGQVTLQEFAIALLIGMLTGAYSSIFVATPMLGWLKGRGHNAIRAQQRRPPRRRRPAPRRGAGRRRARPAHRPAPAQRVEPTRAAPSAPRRRRPTSRRSGVAEPRPIDPAAADATTEQLLSHPPRPRKKKRH